LFSPQQLIAIDSDVTERLRLVDIKSVSFDLPLLEYRRFRTFSSNRSSELPFQLFAGADVPYSASYSAIRRAPHDAQNPRLLQLSASLPDLAGLCFFRLTPIDSRREPHLMIAISMPLSSKIVVGWRESIALPDWDIPAIRAKIDTGARTSALDVDQINLLPDGQVRFDVVLSNKHRRRKRWITAPIVRETIVRSSNGSRETRYVVSTSLCLGGLTRPAEFTLVRRANMLCRLLIGRSALAPNYLVDVARTYVTRPARTSKEDR
jgi:hypothetical protein